PGMKVVQFFENPLTPILNQMVPLSTAPLSPVETCFAVDSTGFSSNKFERWYDHKVWRHQAEVGLGEGAYLVRREDERDNGSTHPRQRRGRLPAIQAVSRKHTE